MNGALGPWSATGRGQLSEPLYILLKGCRPILGEKLLLYLEVEYSHPPISPATKFCGPPAVVTGFQLGHGLLLLIIRTWYNNSRELSVEDKKKDSNISGWPFCELLYYERPVLYCTAGRVYFYALVGAQKQQKGRHTINTRFREQRQESVLKQK